MPEKESTEEVILMVSLSAITKTARLPNRQNIREEIQLETLPPIIPMEAFRKWPATMILAISKKLIAFYPNGEKEREVYYRNGQEEGTAVKYFENGQIKETMPFVKGSPHGTQMVYNENGKLILERQFKEGRKIGEILKEEINN